MNIAVASNRAFLKYLYVMLTSLLEQDSRGDKDIYIYLLSADFSDEDAEMIRRLVEGYGECFHFIRIETDWFPKELPRNEYITVESYFRLAIADLLPKRSVCCIWTWILLSTGLYAGFMRRTLKESR